MACGVLNGAFGLAVTQIHSPHLGLRSPRASWG